MVDNKILMKGTLRGAYVLVFLACSGCITYFGYDGPYEGKVIDKDTNRPIEGAVVHGTWVKAHPGPGGASSSYYDAKEVLTDKNGNFKIDGVGLLIFSNMMEMEVLILKAGYTQEHGYWNRLKNPDYEDDIEWEDGKATFKLRRMTLEERRERVITAPALVPEKKERLFRLEQNRENADIGRPKNTMFEVE